MAEEEDPGGIKSCRMTHFYCGVGSSINLYKWESYYCMARWEAMEKEATSIQVEKHLIHSFTAT